MLRLLTFLTTYRNFILFLGLEAIALYLVVSYNDQQRHALGDALLGQTTKLHDARMEVNEYFGLQIQNDSLWSANTTLHIQLDSLKKRAEMAEALLLVDSLAAARYDSLIAPDSFRYLPARVLVQTTDRNYNYLTLDQGRADGVAPGMGVISPQGVAGMVIRVSEEYAIALSLLNVSFHLTVKVLGEEESNVGVYEWDGKSPRFGTLTYLPETVRLDKGLAVVTAAASTMFPEGYRVGTVEESTFEATDGFNSARIRLATNFNELRYVYLVAATHGAAVDSLYQGLPGE